MNHLVVDNFVILLLFYIAFVCVEGSGYEEDASSMRDSRWYSRVRINQPAGKVGGGRGYKKKGGTTTLTQ